MSNIGLRPIGFSEKKFGADGVRVGLLLSASAGNIFDEELYVKERTPAET
jgi:hypothetical protein